MSAPYADAAARLIREARIKTGLNQARFASTLGKSQSLISKYESGLVYPPGEVIMRCMHITRVQNQALEGAEDWRAVRAALADVMVAIQALERRESSRRGR